MDKQTLTQIIAARTLGLAYLEENQLKEAEFRKVIALAPDEALGRWLLNSSTNGNDRTNQKPFFKSE